MKPLLILISILFANCSSKKYDSNLFIDLAEKENVTIYLNEYKLDSIPAEIGRLTNAKRLYITSESSGWTVYPPLSAIKQPNKKPLIPYLPSEICELKQLKSLGLVNLDLISLPDNFSNLQNLDSIDLSFNNLTLSNEIPKLIQLKNLKYLRLLGNKIDSASIRELEKHNPKLSINLWIE